MKKNFSQMGKIEVQALASRFLLILGMLFIANFGFSQNYDNPNGVVKTPKVVQELQNQNLDFVDKSDAFTLVEAEITRLKAVKPTTRSEKLERTVMLEYYPNLLEFVVPGTNGSVWDGLKESYTYLEYAINQNRASLDTRDQFKQVAELLKQ